MLFIEGLPNIDTMFAIKMLQSSYGSSITKVFMGLLVIGSLDSGKLAQMPLEYTQMAGWLICQLMPYKDSQIRIGPGEQHQLQLYMKIALSAGLDTCSSVLPTREGGRAVALW